MGITVATLGGFLLILGAWFVYRGDIFKSVGVYFMADLCWVGISYEHGDIQGVVFILVGMFLGLGAFFKMNTGILRKDLKW